MPVLSGILAATAIAGVAASGVGIAEQAKSQGIQQTGEKDQNAIAQQEMADKQKAFDQAQAFYTPYTKSGSPYLTQIQSAAAGQNAQQTNNAAGTFRSEMDQRGTGFGPSGSTAGGLAQIGSSAASTGANNYLANLLQNEQVKFQAQQGLTTAGQMAGAPQNQPSVSTQIPAGSTTGAIGAAGQALGAATNPAATPPASPTSSVGSLPLFNTLNPPTPTGWTT
jgi:hypothetical protein